MASVGWFRSCSARCDLKGTPLDKLNTVPKDRKPISTWENKDEACLDVVNGIRTIIEEFSSRPKPAKTDRIWNVPHKRNPLFTGRDELLDELRKSLVAGRATALTQPKAIHGLGGIGKTQTAVEYAHRHRDDYQIVWWIQAQEPAMLTADLAALAQALDLPEKDERDMRIVVEATIRALESKSGWLLIFDNAEDAESVKPFIPQGGHVLITSRSSVWRGVAEPQPVETMKPDKAVEFLLKRTGLTDDNKAVELVKELGYLPLALEQAGAYIDAHSHSFASYLDLFTKRQQEMLKLGKLSTELPDTVATTWELSFQEVEHACPAAAELLNLCAFFAPDSIPISMIKDGAEFLPDALKSAVADDLAFDEAKAALIKYSLVDIGDTPCPFTVLSSLLLERAFQRSRRNRSLHRRLGLSTLCFPQPLQSMTAGASAACCCLMRRPLQTVRRNVKCSRTRQPAS